MALTQIGKEGITGISNSANANAITIDSGENVALSGTLGVTGVVTANAGVKVDNITIDGTEIDLSSGDLTIDVAGNITLDADGGSIILKDGGTQFGLIAKTSDDLGIYASIADEDIVFKGTDGSSAITALTLDMSANGDATFNGQVIVPQYVTHAGDGNTYIGFDTDIIDLYSGGTLGLRVSNSAVVVNENGADKDFRVEGDNDTHALFVQAGSDHVGINNSSPNSSFTGADNLVIGAGSGHTGMTILSGTSSRSSIEFSDGTGSDAAKTAGGIRYYHDNNYMRFNTNGGTESMRINASSQLLLGTATARGKLTLGLNAASSDGIMLDNSNGGATMDIALLGSGYSAHGAAAGEIWFYSPDNINIGGATGNTNHIKFIGNNTLRMLIHGSKPQTDTHGVREYFYRGSVATSQVVVTIDISGISSAGVALVEAAFNHYSINQYGASRTSNLGLYGGGIISTHDIQNITSSNGGSWTYSTPTSGTIRITKNAGSYAGGGFYWVKVTTYV